MDNNIDAIRKYKALLDEGIITQEEFNRKKEELLDLPVKKENDSATITAEVVNASKAESDNSDVPKETEPSIEKPESHELKIPKVDEVINDKTASASSLKEEDNGSLKKQLLNPKVLIAVGLTLLLLIAIAAPRGSSSSGIEGSWICEFICYEGENIKASDAQAEDYSLKIGNKTFEANIYGVETSGTWEYVNSVDEGGDVGEVDFYTFTADTGATFTVEHFKKYDNLIFNWQGGMSSDNYISFKRR